MKPREPGERLWAHADDFMEHAPEVSLAHPEVRRDDVDLGARQALGGFESKF